MPGITEIIGKGVIPLNIAALADAMANHTYLYVFWYLDQLIQLILLAPLLYGILKRPWTAALYFAVLLSVLWTGWDQTPLNGDALFYYSAAAYLAIQKRKLAEQELCAGRRLAGAGIIAAAVVCLYLAGKIENPFFTVLYRFLMVSGLWLFVREGRLKEPKPWMR